MPGKGSTLERRIGNDSRPLSRSAERLGDLCLVHLGTLKGCSSGRVSTSKSSLLKSRYLPFWIRSVSRWMRGGAQAMASCCP